MWWQEVTTNAVGHYRPSGMGAFISSSASTPLSVQSQGCSWSACVCVWKWESLCGFKMPKRTILIQKQYRSVSFTSALQICDITNLYMYKKPLFVLIFEFKLGNSSQNLINVAMENKLVPPDRDCFVSLTLLKLHELGVNEDAHSGHCSLSGGMDLASLSLFLTSFWSSAPSRFWSAAFMMLVYAWVCSWCVLSWSDYK